MPLNRNPYKAWCFWDSFILMFLSTWVNNCMYSFADSFFCEAQFRRVARVSTGHSKNLLGHPKCQPSLVGLRQCVGINNFKLYNKAMANKLKLHTWAGPGGTLEYSSAAPVTKKSGYPLLFYCKWVFMRGVHMLMFLTEGEHIIFEFYTQYLRLFYYFL